MVVQKSMTKTNLALTQMLECSRSKNDSNTDDMKKIQIKLQCMDNLVSDFQMHWMRLIAYIFQKKILVN